MSKKRVPMVYIAGPISLGDYITNVRRGIDAGERVARLGLVPFIPHQDFLWCLRHPKGKTWGERLNYDEQVILRCDAVFRIKGESRGADREEEFAGEHGIPVFRSLKKLAKWAKKFSDKTAERRIARAVEAERERCVRIVESVLPKGRDRKLALQYIKAGFTVANYTVKRA
jgi:hypothetical protein